MTASPPDELPRNGAAGKLAAVMGILLAAAVLLVFGRAIWHDFVNYDDDEYFYANPHIQEGITVGSLAWAFRTTYAGNWFPLTWLSLMLDVKLFGVGSAGPHFTNVMLHAGNSVLLFLLLRRLTGALGRSALVAGLFALHPLHVESVAWVSERKDLLSALFGFLTLWMYGRYAWQQTQPCRSASYGSACLFFALGLMSKPMLVTWPFVMMLLDYWPLRRGLQWKDKLPFLALSAASCVVTFWAQRSGGAVESLARLPLEARIGNAVIAYVLYIHKAGWPTGLAAFYPLRVGWPAMTVAGAIIALAGVTGAVIWFRRQAPWLLTGWFWYLGMLVPVIGLVQVGAQAMADRYSYVPLVGLFLMVCWSVPHTRFSVGVATAALVICGVLSWIQVGYWKNTETLFQHALRVTRGNWLAHYNLATHASAAGRAQDAIQHYREALRIEPDFAEAHNNLGVALMHEGQLPEAIEHFQRAMQIKPSYAEAHNNLGVALTYAGRADESLAHFEKALQIQPGYAQAAYNRGRSCALLGRMTEAIKHWEDALRVQPEFAAAHYDLGVALAASGRVPEAVEHWEQAVRIQPHLAEAHYNLAFAAEQAGNSADAIEHYKQALQARPDYAEAKRGLERLQAVR
jgi:tetratricopeptide (TPR) repeat protein